MPGWPAPKLQTTTENVELILPDGEPVPVAIQRHRQARRFKLSVDERGARLTLPAYGSLQQALDFLHAHRGWLARHWHDVQAAHAPALCIGQTRQLPLRGEQLGLHWQPGRITRLQQQGDALCFEVRGLEALQGQYSTPAIRRALRDFYEAHARADVARWLPRYRDGLPKAPARIQFKRTRSRWGSLSWNGNLALDLALILARPSAFEYVLVHELCHLIHHNHSPAFWHEVEQRFPAWRDERDYLRREGLALKARIQQLLG
ncbi:hypothetical protein CO610_11135 [Lysobacteraceae bacterium NML95-0200]|nr:hypothetical protein CO610_11135 [Xanthomonadaceae bacterium NML95-0200]